MAVGTLEDILAAAGCASCGRPPRDQAATFCWFCGSELRGGPAASEAAEALFQRTPASTPTPAGPTDFLTGLMSGAGLVLVPLAVRVLAG